MNQRPRVVAARLTRGDIPTAPGVYAWHRSGKPMYIGKGKSIQERIWGRHLRRGMSMKASALRRNVAEILGFGSALDIKAGRTRPTRDQVERVNAWLRACSISWIESKTPDEAIDLETRMK